MTSEAESAKESETASVGREGELPGCDRECVGSVRV
jgi:hypothetical protein